MTTSSLVVVLDTHWCFFLTDAGKKRALAELQELLKVNRRAVAKLHEVLRRIDAGAAKPGDIRSLGHPGLLEARAQHDGVWLRLYYFTEQPHRVAVKVVQKKRNKADPDDIAATRRAQVGWTPEDCSGAFRFESSVSDIR